MQRREFLKALIILPFASFLHPSPFQSTAYQRGRSYILIESVVVCSRFNDELKVWPRMNPGNLLWLEREPDNPYDPLAVAVYFEKNKLGYLPRAENGLVSHMMDTGEDLRAMITWLDDSKNKWKRVGIRVEIDG